MRLLLFLTLRITHHEVISRDLARLVNTAHVHCATRFVARGKYLRTESIDSQTDNVAFRNGGVQRWGEAVSGHDSYQGFARLRGGSEPVRISDDEIDGGAISSSRHCLCSAAALLFVT
jgi:hypothetical protein